MSDGPVERFQCAPGMRLQAHERVSELQFVMLGDRLDRIEVMIERLEKRLWLTVYGVAAAILAQAAESFLLRPPPL